MLQTAPVQEAVEAANVLRDDPLIFLPFILLLLALSIAGATIRNLLKRVDAAQLDASAAREQARNIERDNAERAIADRDRLITTLLNVQQAIDVMVKQVEKLEPADKRDVRDVLAALDLVKKSIDDLRYARPA